MKLIRLKRQTTKVMAVLTNLFSDYLMLINTRRKKYDRGRHLACAVPFGMHQCAWARALPLLLLPASCWHASWQAAGDGSNDEGGPALQTGDLELSYWLLALAWPCPGNCGHPGTEPGNGSSLSTSRKKRREEGKTEKNEKTHNKNTLLLTFSVPASITIILIFNSDLCIGMFLKCHSHQHFWITKSSPWVGYLILIPPLLAVSFHCWKHHYFFREKLLCCIC